MKITGRFFHALRLTAVAAALLFANTVLTHSAARAELTQAQAIARVKTIFAGQR